MFKITSVKTQKLESEEGSRLVGLARVVLDNAFAIGDIRIIKGDKGLFIAFPSRKQQSGEFKDVCHPINSNSRKIFEDAILNEFNKGDADDNDDSAN